MRNLLVMCLVAVISIAGVVSAPISLLGYVWFSLMRPDLLAYAAGAPYSATLAIVAFLSNLRSIRYLFLELFTNPLYCAFLVLQIPLAISVAASTDVGLSFDHYRVQLPAVITCALIPLTIRSWRWLAYTVATMGFSILFLGAKFGAYGLIKGGVRITDGPGGMIGDNNVFAAALVTALPLGWYSMRFFDARWIRTAWLLLSTLSVSTILMTHSRGGILALAVVVLYGVYRSRRIVLGAIVVVALIAPSAYLVWDSLVDRMATLQDVDSEDSARSRKAVLLAGIRALPDYWLHGAGFGASPFAKQLSRYLPEEQAQVWSNKVLHNTWLQIGVDSGVCALAIYLFLYLSSIFWLRRQISIASQQHPEQLGVLFALEGALWGFGVASTFVSRTVYDMHYMILMTTAAAYSCAKNSLPVRDDPAT